jgi:hypothetical protein
MKPIVVIGSGHIFSARNDEVWVVTKPDTVQDKGIEPIHHIPQGIGSKDAGPERSAAVDIPHQEPEEYTEDKKGGEFLNVKNKSSRFVGFVDEPKSPAAFDYGRRIIEDGLDGIP